jgi:ankyrin repeat protein
MTTKHGCTPLHDACEHGASPQVIQHLVDAHPKAVVRINKLGKTPHQTAQKNNAEPMTLSLLAECGQDGHLPLSMPKDDHIGEEEKSRTDILSMELGSEKVTGK